MKQLLLVSRDSQFKLSCCHYNLWSLVNLEHSMISVAKILLFLLRIVNSSAVCFLTPSSYVEYHPENLGNSNFFRSHCVKMSKYWLSLTRTFPYKVNFGVSKILFLYGKLRVRQNPYLGKLYAVLYELTLLQKLAPNLQKHLDQKTPLSIVVRSQRTRKLVHNSSS